MTTTTLTATQLVRDRFNRVAHSYADAAVLSQSLAEQIHDRLQFIKLEPARILDLGSGPGTLTPVLKTLYSEATVYALDVAEKMLLDIPNAICADAACIPLANHSIDFCCMNLLLPFLSDRKIIFQEVKRILKPGGLLLFTTLGPDTLKELRTCFKAVDNQPHTFPFTDMHDIGDELMSLRFEDPVVDMQTQTLAYKDLHTLHRDLKQSGASFPDASSSLNKAEYQQLLAAFDAQREEGYVPMTAEIIFGHAWRAPLQVDNTADASGEVHISLDQIQRR
ncbi:MAG: malonyl-[acyl-carrier protein] O-methyltransferase 1 [marine bacterium B5-7]|nr:MAG: malonyl-[acyl-carrier protein] O-methyltransferase 1 [marine bacterium B5-7]